MAIKNYLYSSEDIILTFYNFLNFYKKISNHNITDCYILLFFCIFLFAVNIYFKLSIIVFLINTYFILLIIYFLYTDLSLNAEINSILELAKQKNITIRNIRSARRELKRIKIGNDNWKEYRNNIPDLGRLYCVLLNIKRFINNTQDYKILKK